jgi:AraC-like DNA-binding protein
MKKVLEEHLASELPVPPLDRIAESLGYATDGSLRTKFPELCGALAARLAEQKRARVAAIGPALEQAVRETPPPTLRQVATRVGFSTSSVLRTYAPDLYERLKTTRKAHEERGLTELRVNLEVALAENPPPTLKSVYARLGVTESIASTNFPELRCEIGRRSRQHRMEQAQARRDTVRAEIREIVRTLHAQGVCPTFHRVTNLLKDGFLREWKVVGKAVTDARSELVDRPTDPAASGNGANTKPSSTRDP